MFDILIKNGQVVDGSGGMKDLTGQRFAGWWPYTQQRPEK